MSRKRILFVDDDEAILRAIARTLRTEAHRWDLTFVLGGAAAIALLQTQAFDLLVTDHDMPGTDGVEVLAAAERIAPLMPRILFTGASVDATASRVFAVIAKTSTPRQLRDALQGAIDAGQE